MTKKTNTFPLKQEVSKITIRIDQDLKKKLLKIISGLKKQNPTMKISINELLKQYIINFIGDL